MKRKQPILGAALAVLLVAAAMGAMAPELLTVVQREAALRKEKRLLSARVAVVREGDRVARLEADGSWLRVEHAGAEGWIPVSAVSSDRKVVLSGEALSRGVRATEQSAGARGFNPQVEARHRSTRSDLREAYAIVDRLEKLRVPEEDIERFARAGRLGAFARETAVAPPSPATNPPSAARPMAPWRER